MRLSVGGEEGGCLMGESGLLQFVGLVVVPVFKMLHTLVKHTVPPSHCREDLLCGPKKRQLRQKPDQRNGDNLTGTYVSFLALL